MNEGLTFLRLVITIIVLSALTSCVSVDASGDSVDDTGQSAIIPMQSEMILHPDFSEIAAFGAINSWRKKIGLV